MYNTYLQNGVIIKPNVIAEGDTATIAYNGLLYKSGADNLYLHVGYGREWDNAKDIKMSRTNDGFEARLPIEDYNKLNVAFKDCANNWDNNGGYNYSFDVQSR